MDPSLPPPEVSVLLLGDPEVGKTTFLSRLFLGVRPQNDDLPPYNLPTLYDSDQPFRFDITLYGRPYKLSFYDTDSPTNYTLLKPDYILLCYDISSRPSLESVHTTWRTVINTHFTHDENIPVMVLGLKRDLRKQWTLEETKDGGKGSSVMPHEALRIAQQMLCDQYAECSALTGELCREVLEDLAKTCAKTTTPGGAKSNGPGLDMCMVM